MLHERSIKLIIESKIYSITLLSEAVKAICKTVIHDEVLLFNMVLCLVEAVTNVINHAYHRNPEYFIEVIVNIDDKQLTLQIIDTGDKASIPTPKKELDYNPEELTTWPESGMGLFLIHKIMDEILTEEKNGKNILIMKKNLSLL